MNTETIERATATLTSSSADPATNPRTSRFDFEPSAQWRSTHIGLDETWHRQVAKLAANVETFTRTSIRDGKRRSRWLVIGGKTGSGKTHAAKAVYRRFRDCRIWAWEMGLWGGAIPDATFWRWQNVVSLERREWLDVLAELRGQEQLRGSDLLVLDDVGAEVDPFKSGEPTERLQAVLDIMERKWVLMTTNVPKKQWATRWNQRVASRLAPAAFIDLFNVPDYRARVEA